MMLYRRLLTMAALAAALGCSTAGQSLSKPTTRPGAHVAPARPVKSAAANASTTTGPRRYGWYDNAAGTTDDRWQQMAAHSQYANTTFVVRWWVESDWQGAAASGLCVVVAWPTDAFDAVAAGAATVPDMLPLAMPGNGYTFGDFRMAMAAHADQVCIVGIADEKDCGALFPNWPASACSAMAAKLEANARVARAIFGQSVKLWINYTSAWAKFFIDDLGVPRDPTPFGVSLPASADWISFDAYTDFEHCFGRYTCAQLLAGLRARLGPGQQLVLVPRAFAGSYLGFNPTDEQVAAILRQYLAYMEGDQSIAGMFPFIYNDLAGVGIGARSRPVILNAAIAAGLTITGKVPPVPVPPAAVTGLRIVYE